MIILHDELLIPLLYRMTNLEKLALYLVECDKSFVDGYQLKRDIIDKMPQLNQFVFNISSTIDLNNEIDLPTNDDIQNTFRDFKNNQITSYINYFAESKKGRCQINSYPVIMRRREVIANNFPDGIFKCVRQVALFDERPFEHEFFLRLQKAFPLMNSLLVNNKKAQNNKLSSESNNNNQQSLNIVI
ncbi:unnamed protein product [Rotaria magnacalcarata]|uniref:Uncharacterized protein n=1 Tax=Rotaria magnacalcarata TaxID=392030 RepID=A0A816U956_9BILA|nr:unnamed protein product [Rotaria magnacalcarata]